MQHEGLVAVLINAAKMFDEVRIKEYGIVLRLNSGINRVEHIVGWEEMVSARFDIMVAAHRLMSAKLEAA